MSRLKIRLSQPSLAEVVVGQTDRYLDAVVALAQAGNQIKLNLVGKLGLGEAKVGFLKRYLILVTHTH